MMYIIYDNEGTPIGIITEYGIEYTTIKQILEEAGCTVVRAREYDE